MPENLQELIMMALIATGAIIGTDALKKIWLGDIIAKSPMLVFVGAVLLIVFAGKISRMIQT